jgi:hypothetical protein
MPSDEVIKPSTYSLERLNECGSAILPLPLPLISLTERPIVRG